MWSNSIHLCLTLNLPLWIQQLSCHSGSLITHCKIRHQRPFHSFTRFYSNLAGMLFIRRLLFLLKVQLLGENSCKFLSIHGTPSDVFCLKIVWHLLAFAKFVAEFFSIYFLNNCKRKLNSQSKNRPDFQHHRKSSL